MTSSLVPFCPLVTGIWLDFVSLGQILFSCKLVVKVLDKPVTLIAQTGYWNCKVSSFGG